GRSQQSIKLFFKKRSRKLSYEKSKRHIRNNSVWLLGDFAWSAGGQPAARRRLCQLHHSGRSKRTVTSHHWRGQHSGRLVFARQRHHRQREHRRWGWGGAIA